MKKLFFPIFLIIFSAGYSQITLDFQTSMIRLVPVNLSNSETKYFDQPGSWSYQNQFSLYNLDGTLYKTIQMPTPPDPSAVIQEIGYISNSLFDTDPATIEYLVHYDPCDSILSGAPWSVKIIREDGTVLLDEANASFNYINVYNTEQGAKLMLSYYYSNSAQPFQKKVFSLPGELPTGVNTPYANISSTQLLYPNPNDGRFFVNTSSKPGDARTIELYSITGKLIRSYRSDSKTLQINEPELPNGMYILNSKTGQGCQNLKLMIQK